MSVEELIQALKRSQLYAECSLCGEEFSLSKSILFDGTKPFPAQALSVQQQYEEQFKERCEELRLKTKRATTGAQTTAKAVNVGKMLEKILPTIKDFKWTLPDCRFLGEPIDFITFKGLSRGKLEFISFVEVKSGGARLNEHQKSVKDAIEDKKVVYKEFTC